MGEGERQGRQRFEALFASYSSDIVAYCGWRAGSASDAQDAAAEVFLTAWRRLDELPEGDAARVWLYATARRVIANQRRSSRRQAALYERLAVDATRVPRPALRSRSRQPPMRCARRSSRPPPIPPWRPPRPGRRRGPSAPRRRLLRASTVGTLAVAAAAVAAFLTVGGPGTGPGVANAAAAVRKAATVTAAAAEGSGTAVVRIDHNDEPWAGTTVRWHGQDMAKEDMAPTGDVVRRPAKVGSKFLVVDGTMYGLDAEDGGWVVLGSPDSIDPDSGTTPDEYLAAVREDVGGATLRRITDGMTSPVQLQGSTVQRSRHDPGPDRPRERRTTAPRAPRRGSDRDRQPARGPSSVVSPGGTARGTVVPVD